MPNVSSPVPEIAVPDSNDMGRVPPPIVSTPVDAMLITPLTKNRPTVAPTVVTESEPEVTELRVRVAVALARCAIAPLSSPPLVSMDTVGPFR